VKPPLEMPTELYSQHEFELQRVDYSAPEAAGRIGGVQAGVPLWMGVWTLDQVLCPEESDEVRAFMAQIRGATRRFLGRDIGRPYPKAHAGGFAGMTRPDASPFDGTATSWSEAITADSDSQVTLRGLPVGLTLGVGDYIGFHWVATEASSRADLARLRPGRRRRGRQRTGQSHRHVGAADPGGGAGGRHRLPQPAGVRDGADHRPVEAAGRSASGSRSRAARSSASRTSGDEEHRRAGDGGDRGW
jgi:hypothetical protein